MIDRGDTAWLLTSTALVLFMTIPGLSLFYGGLVRTKNVLSLLMHCFVLTALVTVLWLVYGYSLAFDTRGMVAGVVNANRHIRLRLVRGRQQTLAVLLTAEANPGRATTVVRPLATRLTSNTCSGSLRTHVRSVITRPDRTPRARGTVPLGAVRG